MRKIGIIIEVILVCLQLAVGLTFAQVPIVSHLSSQVKQADNTAASALTKVISTATPTSRIASSSASSTIPASKP